MCFFLHDNSFGSLKVNCFGVTPNGSEGTSFRIVFRKGLGWDESCYMPPHPPSKKKIIRLKEPSEAAWEEKTSGKVNPHDMQRER